MKLLIAVMIDPQTGVYTALSEVEENDTDAPRAEEALMQAVEETAVEDTEVIWFRMELNESQEITMRWLLSLQKDLSVDVLALVRSAALYGFSSGEAHGRSELEDSDGDEEDREDDDA